MTVSELIRALSSLENQGQEIYLRGNNCFIVPIKSIIECSDDEAEMYVLTDGNPISVEKAAKELLRYSCS